ncbi:hypothetical protein QQ056_03910 [Oscillatoria laete-virens NRMC-F 0139]|nr:hypothetical protein [Oscillatoria laete-virens]MDL5052705.1 hypothetical protein [Oscillatoria laete-virens NRMC-F 0139]
MDEKPLMTFPELVPVNKLPSQYEYEFFNARDFYLYRIINKTTKSIDALIYFGMNPRIKVKNIKSKTPGRILSKNIQWNIDDKAMECIFEYKHGEKYEEIYIHIIIFNRDINLINSIENINFKIFEPANGEPDAPTPTPRQ